MSVLTHVTTMHRQVDGVNVNTLTAGGYLGLGF